MITLTDKSASQPLTLAAATLGFAVVQLDVTVVNVALQPIAAALSGDIESLQWIVDAYTIVFASLIPAAGALGDRIGARRIFTIGLALFTLASVGCAAAPSVDALIAARAVQGIGASALVPCSLALINHSYGHESIRARAVAIWAAGASVALAGGPVVGGLLIASIGWRSIFVINLPIGLVGIWLAQRYTTETPRSADRRPDVQGQCAIVVALAALAGAAIEGGRLGLDNTLVLACLVICFVTMASFVALEARAHDPMLPLSFFRDSNFAVPIFVGLVVNIAYYGLIFLLSLFFQSVKAYSPLVAGLAFVPMTVGVLASNLVAGRITATYGSRVPMVLGQAIFAAGCVCLLSVAPRTPFREMWWQLALIGLGLGLVVPPMTTAVLGAVPRHQSGIASGALNATRQAGSVIGVALYGSLIAGPGHWTRGMNAALCLSIALLLLGGAASFRYVRSTAASKAIASSNAASARCG